MLLRATTIFGLAVLCTACGSGLTPTSSSQPIRSSSTPETRYDLANGCYAIKALTASMYVARQNNTYAATAATPAQAEAFYLKPSALGRYLIYSRDSQLLTANEADGSVTGAMAPTEGADWVVETSEPERYLLKTRISGKGLAVGSNGGLQLANAATKFVFVPVSGCTPYPEMPVDIVGEPYKGQGINQPVIGFADAHTHMSMGNEMSDGADPVGPSAGGVMYGQAFNRFGVTEALGDCSANHGPDGIKDAGFVIEGGAPSRHDTQGWPTFIGWPVGANITHQGMYYRWVERAYKAGLRLMVNLGTNIEALCEFGVQAGLGQPGADCKDMSVGIKQVKYTYQMQDYIDAQMGGPGKGWFRIVKTPAEARSVINDGKLAVVLGLEFANIFDCNVVFNPDGSETRGCDQAHIDQRINEVHDLGVRQIYLYHDVNSALGGTALLALSPLALNLVGFYGTHQFWKTYDCPDVRYFAQDEQYPINGAFYTAGTDMTLAVPGTGADPITQALFAATAGALPVYSAGRKCNARGTTDLGRYAMQQAMKKKFVLDTDHAELSVKKDMIALAKQQIPKYPLVSMHGGHGGISEEMARDMLDLGGLIFPYNPNGVDWMKTYRALKAIWPQGRPLAMGYGFDGNGIGGMPPPRGAARPLVKYPFKLFEGPGWGPQFAAAGIKPVTVNELTIPESHKSWNIDVDGEPHYGMVADFVETVRLEGGEEATTALYNSAEAYIQMWERVYNR